MESVGDETRFSVDNATLIDLKKYYDKENDIQACRKRKLHETFRPEWTVGLWYETQHEVRRLTMLNREPWRSLLRQFLSEAHDYLTLFQFCGYYCVRDMARWVEELDTAAREGRQPRDPLPFGVVALGMNRLDTYGTYVSVRAEDETRRHLVFECDNEALHRRYDFYVFDMGAVFEPLLEKRAYNDPDADIQVVSPFEELYRQRTLINEARTCLFDANFEATHPLSFIVAKPLPDSKLETVPEEIRFSMDSLALATSVHGLERINMSTTLAQATKDRMNRTRHDENWGRAQHRRVDLEQATLYNERRLMFVRPDPRESLEVLPESMEVARGPVAVSLVNLEELQRRYEGDVCAQMEFPHFFMKPQAGDKSGGMASQGKASEDQLVFAQAQLEEAVVKLQTVFQCLFTEAYARTFGVLDASLWRRPKDAHSVKARVHFPNVTSKTDGALTALLPFHQAGIVGDTALRQLIARNYGMDEAELAKGAYRRDLKEEAVATVSKTPKTKKRKASAGEANK